MKAAAPRELWWILSPLLIKNMIKQVIYTKKLCLIISSQRLPNFTIFHRIPEYSELIQVLILALDGFLSSNSVFKVHNNLPDILRAWTIPDHIFYFGGSILGATAHKRAQIKLGPLQPSSIFYISATAPCWRLACNVASVFFMIYIPGECWADWSHSGLQIGKQMCGGGKKICGKKGAKRKKNPETLRKSLGRGTCLGLSERAETPQKHHQNSSQRESSGCWMSPNPGVKAQGLEWIFKGAESSQGLVAFESRAAVSAK